MKITDLLSASTIDLNTKAKDKNDILEQAINLMSKSGVITDTKVYKRGVFAREKISTTGVGEGIAIPHCKSNVVKKPHLVAMVIKDGVDFQSLDGEKVQLLFLIAAPNTKDNIHLDVLAKLSSLLMHEEFKNSLLSAKNKKEFLAAINKAEKEVDALVQEKQEVKTKDWPEIVCITACATGIAHTYMAQEALDKAAKNLKVKIKVETQGAVPKNILTQEEIDHAKAVIIAADISVARDRFNNKPIITVSTARAIKDSSSLIKKALEAKPVKNNLDNKSTKKSNVDNFGEKQSAWQKLYRNLLGGLNHMIPFVVAGGILLAISYIIDGACGVDKTAATGFGTTTLAALWFNVLGNFIILYLMVPIFAGFTARAIGGKSATLPGFIAGFASILVITLWTSSKNPAGIKISFNILWFIDVGLHGGVNAITSSGKLPELAQLSTEAMPGFLGGLAGAFAAGYLTLLFNKALSKMPKSLMGLRDILIIPLLSAFSIAVIMFLLNCPFAYITYGLKLGLVALGKAKLLLILGFILGLMQCIDMGGPINKAAVLFCIGLVTDCLNAGTIMKPEGIFAQNCMAAMIAGSMVPPMSLALACWLFPQKFDAEERKAAPANIITGFCGITEGAIPYVAKRPIIWVATISGGGVAGLMAILFNGVSISSEGGYIAFFTMAQDCWRGILGSIVGVLWSTLVLGFILKDVNKNEAKLGKWKGIPTKHVQNFFIKCGHKVAHTTKYIFSKKYRNDLKIKQK